MRNWILLGVTLLLLGAAPRALAQSPPPLEQVELSIWPEYDRRAALVIYRVRLADDLALPATVSLPIPTAVGEPHAVAYADPSGSLINAEYERTVDGDWAAISLEAETPSLWLEYYTDLTFANSTRTFTVRWPATWPVGELTYEIQQPLGAGEVSVSTGVQAERTGQDGLTYYLGSLGVVGDGEGAVIDLRYDRSLDELTVDLLSSEGAVAQPTATGQSPPEWLVPAAIGVAVLVLGGGTVYWFSQRGVRARPAPRKPQRAAPKAESARYCHNCGHQAQAGDRFCRNCGTELRRD